MDTMISADEMQVLFDALPDVVFFVKDNESRYTHLNLTLVQRLGRKHRSEVIGKSTVEVFPLPLGGNYLMQDRRVLHGEVIENQLEVHLFPNRTPGWCLTFKRPLCHQNEVVGVVGISRDLGQPDSRHSAYERLNRALKYMQAHHGENLRIKTLSAGHKRSARRRRPARC